MKTCPKCHTENTVDSRFCQNCGYGLLEVQGEPDDPYLGRTFAGKYLVQQVLGAGAMGKVYLAEHLALGRPICIKILHPHLAEDKSLTKRFHREARAASRLNHPNSIQVIDFGQSEDGVLYIAMEYVPGIDLRRIIKRDFPLPTPRIIRMLGQVLSALEEAHGQGVIHRDLKPENIMIGDSRAEQDHVKVLDFGIAKIQEPGPEGGTLTVAGIVCGTPEYMAPEQARGDPLDPRVDLYAAGIILYQMLSGELPFKADSALATVTKHLTEQPIPPHVRRPDLSVDMRLEAICLRAMSKDREQRYPSALAMKKDLESVSWGTDPSVSAPLYGTGPIAGTPSSPGTQPAPHTQSGTAWSINTNAGAGSQPALSQPSGSRQSAPVFGATPSTAGGGAGPMSMGPGASFGGGGPSATGLHTPVAFAVEDGPPGRREKSSGLAAWIAAGAIVVLGGVAVTLWKLEVGPFASKEKRSASAGVPKKEEAPLPVEPAKPAEPPKQAQPTNDAGLLAGTPAVSPLTPATAVVVPDAGAADEPHEEEAVAPRRRVASAKPGEDPEAALRAALNSAAATSRPKPPKPPPEAKAKSPREYYDEGIALVRARDYRGAVKLLTEAVRGSPSNGVYHRDLAKAHRLTGNTRHAHWHYQKYRQFSPNAADLESVRQYVGAPE